jgi:hypothetical protein
MAAAAQGVTVPEEVASVGGEADPIGSTKRRPKEAGRVDGCW